jgi:hypothetical protein
MRTSREKATPDGGSRGHAPSGMDQKTDGPALEMAIEYAIEFLVGLVARQRIAAVEDEGPPRCTAVRLTESAPERDDECKFHRDCRAEMRKRECRREIYDDEHSGIEKMLANAFAFVPSAEDLRTWSDIAWRGGPATSQERIEMDKADRAIRFLHSAVGADPSTPLTADELRRITEANTASLSNAIRKEWRKRREVAEYTGTETALAGLRTSPALGPASESWQEDRRKLNRELGELLHQQHALHEQAIAALVGGQAGLLLPQRDDYERLSVAINEKRTELERLDGAKVFANVTDVRHALSERTDGERAEGQRIQNQIEQAKEELAANTGGNSWQRLLRQKIAKLSDRLRALGPGPPWVKKVGSKAEVYKLAKLAGLTKRSKLSQ